jgi:hypothetical protein
LKYFVLYENYKLVYYKVKSVLKAKDCPFLLNRKTETPYIPSSGYEIEEYLTKSGELDFNLIKAMFRSEGKVKFRISFASSKT